MKNMKVLTLITLMLISVFIIQTAYARRVSVTPMIQKLYTGVVPGRTGRAEGTYRIENLENVSITLAFKPIGDIENSTKIEDSITMEPGEIRNVDFVVEVIEPGTYRGWVSIYSPDASPVVEYQAEVTVFASESEEQNPFTGNFFLGLTGMHIIGILVVVIILLSIVYVIKRRK